MTKLPLRQVHLDFHTSESIRNVGARFDADVFQRALRLGRVNSVTLFAKCHHSWSYYPTRIGQPHPHLRRNLLQEQITACHAIGVRCPIYLTVGWSANDARMHPEWCCRNNDGSISTWRFDPHAQPTDAIPGNAWINLCPSGAYRRLILEQTLEICQRFPVDGIFYDICNSRPCWCGQCVRGMRSMGLDPERDDNERRYCTAKWLSFMTEARALVHRHHPDATLFFNGQTKMETPDELKALHTHFELEDLPTTWGGYDKLPLRTKYYSLFRKPMLAMSGKFHTQWGEFGGFKPRGAIRYEAAAMVAFGAGCSFGDQLHPSGEVDLETYRRIGYAYRHVGRIEDFVPDAEPCSSLAMLLSGAQAHDQGVAQMLLETQRDFEVAHPASEWSRYETMVLPGARFLDDVVAARLAEYVRSGGSLLVLGQSALHKGSDRLMVDVGAKYLGPPRFDVDYLLVTSPLAKELPRSAFLNYTPAQRFRATRAKVLAAIHEPFFSRTYGHYCSHLNTPHRLRAASHQGAFQHGRVVFLPHPLGEMYHAHGARVHRDLLINALGLVHRRPMVRTTLPSAGRVNLLHQTGRSRYIVHLLYAPPLQRGRCLVIEDMPELRGVPLELAVPERIRRVRLPLAKKTLRPARVGRKVRVTVPSVRGHQVVLFEY